MKQLTCEMCGSTDLVKEGDVFVCQSCGCKYSLEAAKKMMIEGTVEVAGTVKVDDSAKIDNYYMMAENAYDAGNKAEAENYCNKIIEIDPTNYKAWFMKGRAAGWQSTLANVRIEESVNCFTKAIDNAPEDKVEEIKSGAASEISSLSRALMQLCCNNFAELPTESNKNRILNSALETQKYILLLLQKCGVKPTEFNKDVATMMNTAAVSAWNNVIFKEYQEEQHPSKYDWEKYQERGFACCDILKIAIQLSDDDKEADVQRYKNLIVITQTLVNSYSVKYSGNGLYVKDWSLTEEAKKANIDQIMAWHQKIKEIDPNYVIPERPQPLRPASGGCYVATAVYGSYDCPEVWTLRRYRDYGLAKSWYGRAFIHAYYVVSPMLVRLFGDTDWFKAMWRGKLDRMVKRLQKEGYENTPYEDRNW